jgi:hypothetical protein
VAAGFEPAERFRARLTVATATDYGLHHKETSRGWSRTSGHRVQSPGFVPTQTTRETRATRGSCPARGRTWNLPVQSRLRCQLRHGAKIQGRRMKAEGRINAKQSCLSLIHPSAFILHPSLHWSRSDLNRDTDCARVGSCQLDDSPVGVHDRQSPMPESNRRLNPGKVA